MTWHTACRREDIPPGRGWPVRIEGQRVAVFESGGRYYALANTCLHLESPIDDGAVIRGIVTCPWHGWRYDVKTGDLVTKFGRRPGLASYPVRVEGDEILIDLPAAPTPPIPEGPPE